MDWGMPWWIGAGPPELGIEQAGRLGFDFLEVSLDAPWPEDLVGPNLRDAATDAGVELAFHGPWRTQALAHPRGVLARAAATVAQACLAFAQGAGAAYLVLHVDASHFSRYPEQAAVQQGLERARSSLAGLAKAAGEGTRVLVENTSTPMGTPAELATFLEGLEGVGFCYDPGHAALAEAYGVEGASARFQDWVEQVGDRLELLHAMDHVVLEGKVVDHLVPGAGQAPLEALIRGAQAAGCSRVLLEAFYKDPGREPATGEDLAEARELLQGFLA